MGGSKKLRLSQLEKRQKEESKREKAERLKSEKIGEILRDEDDKIFEKLKGVKVLTPYVVFNQTGLKMSEAKRLLKRLEERGLVKKIGGNSSVPVYATIQAA